MKNKLALILLTIAVSLPIGAEPPALYELSYRISGNAKGTILLIFPYRVYYTSSASLILSSRPSARVGRLYSLEKIDKTGYMMRTLGFSGRSLGILTASNQKTKGRKFSEELKNDFAKKSPEYYKYIRRSFWNNFVFDRIKGAFQFTRNSAGIQKDLKYHLWMKRCPEEKPLRISFNIYRILGEVVKSADYPILPPGKGIQALITRGPLQWESQDIDFSEFLARSALYAAGIFRKIRRLKQEKPFRAQFSSQLEGNNTLFIRGEAAPEVSVFGSFRIKKFLREIRISTADHRLISDRMTIEVRNKSGKGGVFITSLKRIQPGL